MPKDLDGVLGEMAGDEAVRKAESCWKGRQAESRGGIASTLILVGCDNARLQANGCLLDRIVSVGVGCCVCMGDSAL